MSLKRGVLISRHVMKKAQNICEFKLYPEGVPCSDLCWKTYFSHLGFSWFFPHFAYKSLLVRRSPIIFIINFPWQNKQ